MRLGHLAPLLLLAGCASADLPPATSGPADEVTQLVARMIGHQLDDRLLDEDVMTEQALRALTGAGSIEVGPAVREAADGPGRTVQTARLSGFPFVGPHPHDPVQMSVRSHLADDGSATATLTIFVAPHLAPDMSNIFALVHGYDPVDGYDVSPHEPPGNLFGQGVVCTGGGISRWVGFRGQLNGDHSVLHEVAFTSVRHRSPKPLIARDDEARATAQVSEGWTLFARQADLDALYPERAVRLEKSGSVRLACAPEGGRPTGCRIMAEDPVGYGFGQAALRSTAVIAVSPAATGAAESLELTFQYQFLDLQYDTGPLDRSCRALVARDM